MRTQVGIVGAGPAGLLLAHLLHLQGIESVVLESRSREYVEQRVRAGVLEQGTVDVFEAAGLAGRLRRRGARPPRDRAALRRPRPPDPDERADGRPHDHGLRPDTRWSTTSSRRGSRRGGALLYEVEDVERRTTSSRSGRRSASATAARTQLLECDVVAGCDGFHGVCRPAIPAGALRVYERVYPFGWLGILAEVAALDRRAHLRLPRATASRSTACARRRSAASTSRCRPDEDVDDWSDDRIWSELHTRLASRRRLDAAGGPDRREGDRRAAQLRRRADAARPALPRRRRRSHRAADRREGAQPRRRGRDRPRAGARRPLPRRQRDGARRLLRRPACAASGRRSASRGG